MTVTAQTKRAKREMASSAPTVAHGSGMKLFLLILFVAIGLRFSGITFDSMWLDEGYQTMVDSIGVKPTDLEKLSPEPFIYSLGEPRSTAQVLSNFRQVDPLCPPLYFLLLNRWMTVLGTGDLAVRSLSAILSILSLCVLFFGTRKLLGPRVALFASMLLAISPFDITYAQEARMYALVMLTASASCFSLYMLTRAASGAGPNCEAQERRRLAGSTIVYLLAYSIATWAMINTHYTTLYVVMFQGLYGIAYSARRKSISTFLHLCATWLLVGALWLPWFEMFRQAASGRDNFYVSRASGLLWSFKGLARIPINWFSFLAGGRIVAYAAPAYATCALLLLTCALFTMPEKLRSIVQSRFKKIGAALERFRWSSEKGETYSDERKQAMTFVWCWALVPALVALAIDIVECRKTIEVTRYLIGTAPAVMILAGCGASYLMQLGGKLKWLVIAHVAFVLVNYAYAHIVEQREPWRQMAQLIEKRVPTSDLLLISPHYDMVCLNRYFTEPRMQVGTGPLLGNEQVYKVLEGRQRFWLLTAQQGASVTVFVPPRFRQTDSVKMKHGLELTAWQEQ